MAWATDIATLKTTIEDAGYYLLPENKEPEELLEWQNKSYSIRLDGIEDIEQMTGNKVNYSHSVILKVGYTHIDDTKLRTNETAFNTLFKTIAGLASSKNTTARPLNRIDNKKSIGEINFYYGQDGN